MCAKYNWSQIVQKLQTAAYDDDHFYIKKEEL